MVFALKVLYINSQHIRCDSMDFDRQLHSRNASAEVQINWKLTLLKSRFGISATCDSLNRLQTEYYKAGNFPEALNQN